jgi:hypothetical protein
MIHIRTATAAVLSAVPNNIRLCNQRDPAELQSKEGKQAIN